MSRDSEIGKSELRHTLLIRESHLDTFGHVNNATYLQIFEQIRWDIIESGGYGVAKIKKSGLGPIILEINIRFHREVRLRETVTIVSKPEPWTSGKIMRMTQVMLNEAGQEACTAQFVFGLFSVEHRKLVEPTQEWLSAGHFKTESSHKR